MSEKEKMEAIYRQVQEQGVSPEAVAKYLLEKAEACLSSEKILPGMFVYADNTIRSEIIEGLQIKAVVGYVERNKVYAVCLWEEQLPWSSSYLQVRETRNLADGRKATLEIIKKAQEQNGKAEAVRWCYNYPYDDVESGEAFLPSESELQKIYSNKTAINAALEELGLLCFPVGIGLLPRTLIIVRGTSS